MPAHFYHTITFIDGLWGLWLVVWLIGAMRAKRSIYRQPLRQRLAYITVILAAAICIQLPALRVRWLPLDVSTEAAGVCLCAAGLSFSVWARAWLGRNWSGIVTIKENHELITNGPYRYVRHPIYTGVLTAIAGTVLAVAPSLGGLLAIVLAAGGFAIKARQEEAVMMRQFAEAYPAYKSRVRAAIIPFVI